MSDTASFDAVMQCSLLEVFCEALGAAVFVTDKLDQISFASVRFLHFFAIPEASLHEGTRVRDFYGALHDAGCRFGEQPDPQMLQNREDWVAHRVALGWKERVDRIEQGPNGRWYHLVSRRFSSGLGLAIFQDVTEQKKKEIGWKLDQDRVHLTEEILDTLPVAIAVKDRNLNFAAVNQKFSELFDVRPERLLGKGIWELYPSEIAQKMEKADWALLASGRERRSLISAPENSLRQGPILHRARRIGKPGNHYIAMTFEDVPEEAVLPAGVEISPVAGAADIVQPRRPNAVLVATAEDEHHLACLTSDGFEVCRISDPKELALFLPTARRAGVVIEKVVIAIDNSAIFESICNDAGQKFETFSIKDASVEPCEAELPEEEPPKLHINLPETTVEDARNTKIDVLAVDDNEISRLVLSQILESLGISHAIVATATEFLEKIVELRPRVAFADTTLPDMPIEPLAEATLRQAAAHDLPLTLVGLISKKHDDARAACERAGVEQCLTKPISPEAIDAVMRRILFATGRASRVLA